MSVYDVLQLAGGLILAVGYIPQIVQIIRTKSCADLNLKTYIMMSIGIGMMEIYAVHLALGGTGLMFLATNSLSLCLALLICILILTVGKIESEGESTMKDLLFRGQTRKKGERIIEQGIDGKPRWMEEDEHGN